MFRGLLKLTWLEIKIFLREPLGAFGSIFLPVLVFVVIGRLLGGRIGPNSIIATGFVRVGLPVFASVLIAITGVLSLVTIISIYREGGYPEAAPSHAAPPADHPHRSCAG